MFKFLLPILFFLIACSDNTEIIKSNESILTPLQELLVGNWHWQFNQDFSDLEFTDEYTFEGISYRTKVFFSGKFQFANDSMLKLIYPPYEGSYNTVQEIYKVNKLDKDVLILNTSLVYYRQ